MAGIRERARRETTAEILRLAREQLACEGAAALSLRAIAREMGMVSSAIYRYFAGRDELLTQLIMESYDSLGEAVRAGDELVTDRTDLPARWRATAHALRKWAFDHPEEWALLFGTPVPGYAAPVDTIGPASRYTSVFLQLLAEADRAGVRVSDEVPPALAADLARLQEHFDLVIDRALLARGMVGWANLMGAVSLELFGHLHNVIDTPSALFDAVVEQHVVVVDASHSGTRPARRTSKKV